MKNFINQVQNRISQISIGASSMRNQGSEGLIDGMREYFYKEINLKDFKRSLKNEKAYKIFLEKHTDKLLKKFFRKGLQWGAARKGLNLFLRELVYNKFIMDYLQFPRDFKGLLKQLQFMELPLDSFTIEGLKDDYQEKLPSWKGVKRLECEDSEEFQNAAKEIALTKYKTARIHLDLIYWRRKNK